MRRWTAVLATVLFAACSPVAPPTGGPSSGPLSTQAAPAVVPTALALASPTAAPTGVGPWKVLASSDTAGAGWSPDGRWLLVWDAVTNGTAAQRHISLDDAHGNVIRTFQGELPVELEPVWLDDRSFVIARDGKNYLGTVDSPALRPISPQFSAGVVSNGHDALAYETSGNLDASARFVMWTPAGGTSSPRPGVPVAWSRNGTKLAVWHWLSGTGPESVGWVEALSWPSLRSLGAIHEAPGWIFALFDPSGRYLYANGFVLDLETRQVSPWPAPSPSGPATNEVDARLFPAVAAVTDPDEAAGASADGSTVVLWHMSTQQQVMLSRGPTVRAIDVPGPLQPPDPQLSPDGSHLVISCVAPDGSEEVLLSAP
jgi:hypothetical protein